jgi:hypothetical protein
VGVPLVRQRQERLRPSEDARAYIEQARLGGILTYTWPNSWGQPARYGDSHA